METKRFDLDPIFLHKFITTFYEMFGESVNQILELRLDPEFQGRAGLPPNQLGAISTKYLNKLNDILNRAPKE